MLYIISTPIGNLEDITFRAVRILKEVDLILAEDTRRTLILMKHYQIQKQIEGFNEHTLRKMPNIINFLLQGKNIALVSDAGTPGISDPGFDLVRECVKNNIQISPIPGPTALISALSCSGLPTDRFEFYGFLPKKEKKIKDTLNDLRTTSIFYESPYRIKKTMKIIAETKPDYKIVIARELTKKFEEFLRGTAKDVSDMIEKRAEIKGEIVLIISPK